MTKKEKLKGFSTDRLELIKKIVQTTPPEEITRMINEIKTERKEASQVNWNKLYPIDDLVLDYSIVQLLKENGIHYLQQLMDTDVTKIKGLTRQDIGDIEWAKQFFDMRPLQNMPKTSSQLDVAKTIIEQGNQTNKKMIKKYGHRF